jgi:OFA family oxalate/formate antiporter-like MFS transporter
MSDQPKAMNRWIVVIGAVLIQLALGAIYAWSVFTPGLNADNASGVAQIYSAKFLGLKFKPEHEVKVKALLTELEGGGTEAGKKKAEGLKKLFARLDEARGAKSPAAEALEGQVAKEALLLDLTPLAKAIDGVKKQAKIEKDPAKKDALEKQAAAEAEKMWPITDGYGITARLKELKYAFSNTQTQWVFGVGLAAFAVVMVLAGRLMPRTGPMPLALLGGLVLGAGYVLGGLVAGKSVIMMVVFIGAVGGAGIGLGYVVPIAVGMRWFPDKKGLVSGLAVAGFGFGAMGWVKFAGAWGSMIANMGIPMVFIIYGVAFAVLVILGGLVMKYPPDGWKPAGWTPPEPGSGKKGAAGADLRSGQMLAKPQFYMIFLTFLFSAGAGLMTIGLMKAYPKQALVDVSNLSAFQASAVAGTAMAVFFSLANGIGRIAWGAMSDKLGRKLSVVIMCVTQGILMFAFTQMAGTPWMLYIGATIIGFNFGGNFALFPAITADTFGTKHIGQNYPWVFLSYGVGGILMPVMGGKLGDMGNFPLAFTICAVLCVVGAVLTGLVKPPQADSAEEPNEESAAA